MKINQPLCSVIIVTHNGEKHIPKAMKCLKNQTRQADEIIIVDSGSKNPNYLGKYQKEANVKIILGEKDIGFCKGNNLGMEKLHPSADYVFFLNPDAFPNPDFLENSIAYMENPLNQCCGAITGTTLGYDIDLDQPTGKYDSTGIFHSWYGKWYDRAQGEKFNANLYIKEEDIPAICGAVFFCRKTALDEVEIREAEIFDNTFFMYKEDIDLSLRLRKKGWKLMFVPQLLAYHCRGWHRDRGKAPRIMRLYSAKNELKIHARNLSPIGMLYSLMKLFAVKVFDL
ncbi:MAG: putative glycosyltransferase EpsH [Chlamydiae bacterium]|nr:putative glycosyltransferase EpsH [Chlamydiota bacterium]